MIAENSHSLVIDFYMFSKKNIMKTNNILFSGLIKFQSDFFQTQSLNTIYFECWIAVLTVKFHSSEKLILLK